MKKISLFFITLTFVLLFSFNCFAADFPSLPGEYKYYHIFKITAEQLGSNYDQYQLYEYPGNYVLTDLTNYRYNGPGQFKMYEFKANGQEDSWTLKQDFSQASNITLYYKCAFNNSSPLYVNHVVSDEGGNTVFHKAPLTLVQLETLTPVLRQVVYLLPCLISCLVGLIAFYKAWHWLKMQLSTWGRA